MTRGDFIFVGPKIYTQQGMVSDSFVVVRDGLIQVIDEVAYLKNFSANEILNFPENYHLVPGFIDLHMHGANNCDVMDATSKALTTISQSVAMEGTTAFLATTMTAPVNDIENALVAVRDFMQLKNNEVGATVLGVHLEGPFISPKKAGAQHSEYLLVPNKKYLEQWQRISGQIIKLVTLAPELEKSGEFIRYLKQENIIAAIGHSDATYEQGLAAIAEGCHYATHLFNAMRGIHQREPGIVTAALLSDEVMAEVIVDGVHLHPGLLELILKVKGKEKLILVTDAMRARCLGDGMYELGGQAVAVKNGIARLADNTLAGSVLKMSTAIENMQSYTQCTLFEAIKMASENPAKALGIFARKGSIAVGKDADLVVLDEKLNVVLTMCTGRIASLS